MLIRYIRDNNGNFTVTLLGTTQTIVVLPRFFCRITNASSRAVIGVTEITEAQASTLGFVTEVSANDYACAAIA